MERIEADSLHDDEGIRRAYAAHGAELYGFAAQRLGDAAVAEEVVQEVFVRAWLAADRFDPNVGSLRTWLFAICRNVVIDQHRARAARPLAAGSHVSRVEMMVDPSDQIVMRSQLEDALARLSAPHREVIVEAVLHDRPHAELAAESGVPEGTLRSRLFYGLKALRVVLDEGGWRDDA